MKRSIIAAVLATFIFAGSAYARDAVVNFATCVTESKIGKKEQENLENLRKQFTSMIEDSEKQLKEIAEKFEDADYLDSLSPKAEEELKIKYQALNEDLARYQNQYYQVLNQANYQLIQKMSNYISNAAEKVAQKHEYNYVINKEACFYYNPDMDITDTIIDIMDKDFDLESAKQKISDNSDAEALKGSTP